MRLQTESDGEDVQMALSEVSRRSPEIQAMQRAIWKGPKTRYVEYRIVNREVDFNLMCGLCNWATSDSLSTADLSGFPCKHFTHTQYHTVYSVNIWYMIIIHEIVILYLMYIHVVLLKDRSDNVFFWLAVLADSLSPFSWQCPWGVVSSMCAGSLTSCKHQCFLTGIWFDYVFIWTFNFEHVLFCSCVFDRFEALQPSCTAAMVSLATSATTCWCAGWSMKLRNHTRSYK